MTTADAKVELVKSRVRDRLSRHIESGTLRTEILIYDKDVQALLAAVEACSESMRMAYKTGYQEGIEDGDGIFDREACEEGWQQYAEQAALEASPHSRTEAITSEMVEAAARTFFAVTADQIGKAESSYSTLPESAKIKVRECAKAALEAAMQAARPIDQQEACPICSDRSTYRGNPALSFCDKHYRQWPATFQISPKDLAAYRAKQVDALTTPETPTLSPIDQQEATECPTCQGRGDVWRQAPGLPRAPYAEQCDDCHGTGSCYGIGNPTPIAPAQDDDAELIELLREEAEFMGECFRTARPYSNCVGALTRAADRLEALSRLSSIGEV